MSAQIKPIRRIYEGAARRTNSRACPPQMFAQMWAARIILLAQWYSALINGATRAAYFRGAVGIIPVTRIYRRSSAGSENERERKREKLRERERRRRRPTSPVFTILDGCVRRQQSRRNGFEAGLARREKGDGGDGGGGGGGKVRRRKREKEDRGAPGSAWIDAVLSNHVSSVLSPFHPLLRVFRRRVSTVSRRLSHIHTFSRFLIRDQIRNSCAKIIETFFLIYFI